MNTRKKAALALPLFVLLLFTACRRHQAAVKNEEPDGHARIASFVKMNDPATRPQLLTGFHGVESGAWRWTAGKFSVLLRPPVRSAQRGATFKLAGTIPDTILKKLGPLTLTASINGTLLRSEIFSKAGPYTFSADVPPEFLSREAVTIDFALDKFLAAGVADQRELGVIAMSAGLESK